MHERRQALDRFEVKLGIPAGDDQVARLDHPQQPIAHVRFHRGADGVHALVRHGPPKNLRQFRDSRAPFFRQFPAMLQPVVGVLYAADRSRLDVVEIADIQCGHTPHLGATLPGQSNGQSPRGDGGWRVIDGDENGTHERLSCSTPGSETACPGH